MDLFLYKPFSENILQQYFFFLLTTDLMRIVTLWKVNIFSIGKESDESILIPASYD